MLGSPESGWSPARCYRILITGGGVMDENENQDVIYDVVVNKEEQYSIWRVGREMPAGWIAAGFRGTEDACLAHIDEIWIDMRPRSLRDQHEADGVGLA